MGRPPSNGGPSFRFNHTEVVEMEAILQAHNAQMPIREVLDALAEKFSTSAERSGKVVVQMKQIWNWFQNRRYAIRAKAGKPPAKLTVSTPQNNSTTTTTKNVPLAPQPVPKNVPLAPQPVPSTTAVMRSVPQNTKITAPPPVSVQDSVKNVLESQMEFEARSASDGAWYDVASFLSHRIIETGDPEVLVRFSGFGLEEDEWIDVRKHIRQRSLPCESSECIVVLPGDLILCFQEGKEQALYYDAHILDSQRRRHDIRGCRCRFLVRYDHDQSEEIVPLRKICRRPETDHRLQQLDAESGKVNQQKMGTDAVSDTNTKCSPVMKTAQKAQKLDQTADNHIPKVNQNTELTQPIGNTCSDSIATQVVPATESHTTLAEKEVNKISELTEPHIAKTGSDSIATQVLAATENQETIVQKVTEISDLTQPPIEKTVSDSITTQELSETESHATVVEKVNQISESTHLLVAETETDTLAVDAVKVNETSESIQLPPLAETERPLEAPENHEVVMAAAFTQNSLPPKPVESDSVKSPDVPLQTG